jgi:sugar phosphate isomerase/epimerase
MIEVGIFADEVSSDFEEEVDLSARAGAHCIELRGGLWGRAVQNCTDEDVARAQEILARYDSRVAIIGSPVGKLSLGNEEEYQTHLKWFDRMCELAHTFNTRIIRGFAFWTPTRKSLPRPNLDELIDEIATRLSPIAQRAIDEDVYFCFEAEGSTCSGTCAEIARIIDAITPNDNLMVAWDVNNAARLEEHPFDVGYPLIKDRVKHVHVKPNRFKNLETVWDWEDASYRKVFETLVADGYEGVATVEHWGSRWLMLEGVRQTVELLKQVQG